jgi:ATP-dependent protease ClpP protease subunit
MRKPFQRLVTAALFLLSLPAHAFYVNAHNGNVDLHTAKVAHVVGEVDRNSTMQFLMELRMTSGIPGDRLIVINSPGGEVRAGERMLRAIDAEKAAGVRIVCLVTGEASSMAFNILTHCDVRLATSDSQMTVHKIALGGLDGSGERLTAETLRRIAEDMDRADDLFRRSNAVAMHLSLSAYDEYARKETRWSARTLLSQGYLDALVPLGI